ncbi:hypothetical protein D3C84_457890 [compost metagenome]
MADQALREVGALAGQFGDLVGGVVHHIDVIAQAAAHAIGARAAIERVVGGIAGQAVGQCVAGTVDGGAAEQGQVLDVGGQGMADQALREVGALAGQFGDPVGGVVDHIDVVAQAADQRVDAGTAIEEVVRGVAVEGVVVGRADGVFDGGAVRDGQPLVEGAIGAVVEERLADLAELARLEPEHHCAALVAGVQGVDAAGIPEGLENGLVRRPPVGVVAGLPGRVGAIQVLDGGDIQQHGAGRSERVAVVVAHDGVAYVVEACRQQVVVALAVIEGVLEAYGVADLMDEGQVVVGALGRRRLVGRRADPDVSGCRITTRQVGPGGCVVHLAIAGEAQVAHAGGVVRGQGEPDVRHLAPGGQGAGRGCPLPDAEGVHGQVLVAVAVIGGEVGRAGGGEAVGQRYAAGGAPMGAEQQAVDLVVAGKGAV